MCSRNSLMTNVTIRSAFELCVPLSPKNLKMSCFEKRQPVVGIYVTAKLNHYKKNFGHITYDSKISNVKKIYILLTSYLQYIICIF